MRIYYFDDKTNTLYINTKIILPSGLSRVEISEYLNKPYEERIAESANKDYINAELAKHPGCKISEFIDI